MTKQYQDGDKHFRFYGLSDLADLRVFILFQWGDTAIDAAEAL